MDKEFLDVMLVWHDEIDKSFWIQDLLYRFADQRYRTIPQQISMETENDIENWFTLIASIFRQYGHETLSNRPGTFEGLADAQAKRDAE